MRVHTEVHHPNFLTVLIVVWRRGADTTTRWQSWALRDTRWLLTVPCSCHKKSSLSEWDNCFYFTKCNWVCHQRETGLFCSQCQPAPRCWTQCWSRMTEGRRCKDTLGARTLVLFIEIALACNSSEALVLTVAWQSFPFPRQREGKDGLGRRTGTKEERWLTQGHSSNHAIHTGSQVSMYWLRAPNHTGAQLAYPITLSTASTRGAGLWVANEQLSWSELRSFHPFSFNFCLSYITVCFKSEMPSQPKTSVSTAVPQRISVELLNNNSFYEFL